MENEKSATPLLAVEEKPFMRSVVCLKNKKRLRETERMDDCFILEFDPYLKSSSLLKSVDQDDDAPLSIISEKGHVACRDFPHSRDQCVVYPFSTTDHETHYCKLCHCYVCDVAVPCTLWSLHCDATHKRGDIVNWRHLRRERAGRDIDSDSE